MTFRTHYTAAPGENVAVWVPTGRDAHRRLIVSCHPMTGTVAGGYGRGTGGPAQHHDALADAGYTVIYPRTGGDLWGNATSQGLVDDAIEYAVDYWRADATTVGFLAVSMGNVTASNWALQNLETASLIVSFVPASDVNDIHANNRGGATAAINAAYSGAYVEGTHGPTANPTNYAASLTTPWRAYYAGDDPTVLEATVLALAAALPDGEATDMGNLGHDFDVMNAVDTETVVGLFDAVA